MGRTITPKYRVEAGYADAPTGCKQISGDGVSKEMRQAWNVPENGLPTVDNLERWISDMVRSFYVGHVNGNVSEEFGYIPTFRYARIVCQANDAVRAEWVCPPFWVLPSPEPRDWGIEDRIGDQWIARCDPETKQPLRYTKGRAQAESFVKSQHRAVYIGKIAREKDQWQLSKRTQAPRV